MNYIHDLLISGGILDLVETLISRCWKVSVDLDIGYHCEEHQLVVSSPQTILSPTCRQCAVERHNCIVLSLMACRRLRDHVGDCWVKSRTIDESVRDGAKSVRGHPMLSPMLLMFQSSWYIKYILEELTGGVFDARMSQVVIITKRCSCHPVCYETRSFSSIVVSCSRIHLQW